MIKPDFAFRVFVKLAKPSLQHSTLQGKNKLYSKLNAADIKKIIRGSNGQLCSNKFEDRSLCLEQHPSPSHMGIIQPWVSD